MPQHLTPLYTEPVMPRWWDRFIIGLTIFAMVLLALEFAVEPSSPAGRVIDWVDLGLCAFFLFDFGFRFSRARRKWLFVKHNWLDLLGAIPLVGPLRAARFARLVRILRVTRMGALARRVARRYDLPWPGKALTYLLFITVMIWISAALAFFYFEGDTNDSIDGIDDALWWSMTTLSTVGYGDLYPVTDGGRMVAVATMVLGVGVLGTLAAAVATSFMDFRERGRRGARTYMLKDHVLVLGWNDKSRHAINEFRYDSRYENTPLCIVAELSETPIEDKQVKFVRGAPSRKEVLKRASAEDAAAAMVFARDPHDSRSDHESALVVHALRRINEKCRISAELVDPRHRETLSSVGCDAVIDINGVASNLLVRSVQDVGTGDVISELLSSKVGCEIYRISVDPGQVGHTWKEYVIAMLDSEITPVGLVRDGKISINPKLTVELEKGDESFVIAKDPP